MSPAIAVFLGLLAAGPRVYVEAPDDLEPSLIAAVVRERPAIVLVSAREDAELSFVITRQLELTLSVFERERLLETRVLGADVEPASRLAVLLMAEQISAFETRRTITATAAEPRADVREVLVDQPRVAETITSTPSVPLFRLEAGASVIVWSSPVAPQIGVFVAAARRFDRFAAALQLVGGGLCCGLSASDIEASARVFAAMLEARWVLARGTTEPSIFGAAGVAYEPVSARPIFVGQTVDERGSFVGAVFRAGIRLEFAAFSWGPLLVAGGVQVHPSSLRIELDNPPNPSRQALERGMGLPFVDVGVAVDLF